MKLLSEVEGTACLQFENPLQLQGRTLKKSHLTDLECAYLLKSEALPLFVGVTTGFWEDACFNFWNPEAAATQGTSQIFYRLEDELDRNNTWTFPGAASRQPDLLIFRAVWAHWTPQRLSNEPWFSPDQNKGIFSKEWNKLVTASRVCTACHLWGVAARAALPPLETPRDVWSLSACCLATPAALIMHAKK